MGKELVDLIKKGDEEAFAELYQNYSEYALRVAIAVTGTPALAADAVQETFIRVFRNISDFNQEKPFKPWFYRILINECNRLLKKKSKTIFMSDYFENSPEAACDDRHHFEEYEELYRAIQKLPEINRVPVVLKYLNGFSEKEIAEVLASNVNTVKSRLLRGRQKLKEFLEEKEGRGVQHG